jgi:hypothetical protein
VLAKPGLAFKEMSRVMAFTHHKAQCEGCHETRHTSTRHRRRNPKLNTPPASPSWSSVRRPFWVWQCSPAENRVVLPQGLTFWPRGSYLIQNRSSIILCLDFRQWIVPCFVFKTSRFRIRWEAAEHERSRTLDRVFRWIEEHVEPCCIEPSRAEKHVQDDKRNMCWTELDGRGKGVGGLLLLFLYSGIWCLHL